MVSTESIPTSNIIQTKALFMYLGGGRGEGAREGGEKETDLEENKEGYMEGLEGGKGNRISTILSFKNKRNDKKKPSQTDEKTFITPDP